MVQHNIMFGFIKKMVIGLLTFSISITSINNASGHTKCICLNNQPCMTRTTHQFKYNQGLHYYSFMVNADIYNKSCNTLHDLSNRICVTNKAKDVKFF